MSGRRSRSLQWRLVGRLLALQAALLALVVLLIALTLWSTGLLIKDYEGSTVDVLQGAVARTPEGGLALRATPELAALRSEVPGLWFVVRDRQGHRLSEGSLPPRFAPLAEGLDQVSEARLAAAPGRSARPDGLVLWVDTAAGEVQLLTGTQGRMSARRLVAGIGTAFLNLLAPILALMGLATVVTTPLVVRRALAGLGEAALQAERIDVEQRGVRLPLDPVPLEIRPLVKAVNDALGRLDEGYERQRRFLADAAHELRTPIAILTTRLAALEPGPQKTRLLEDAARLSIVAGQLLDLKRLEQHHVPLVPLDLSALARRVVLELAPLAFAAGYEMAFEPVETEVTALGDSMSLERALSNLIQNAIDHGGRRGTIAVRVGREPSIEVTDEGDGIPPAGCEQVFEPFFRLDPRGRGAGLGLNLVQEVMRLHRGTVAVVQGASHGACLRMTFPPAGRPGAEGAIVGSPGGGSAGEGIQAVAGPAWNN